VNAVRPDASKRLIAVWVGCIVVALLGCVIGMLTGPSQLSALEMATAVLDPSHPHHVSSYAILVDVRLLRVLGSFAVGAALSLAGVLLQAATRNPIADPYLVGTSAGATLAAVAIASIVAAVSSVVSVDLMPAIGWLQPGAAFIGAMTAVSIAFWLARVGGPASPERVLLAGLVLTAFAGAATSFLLYQASDLQLRAATGWLMGGVVAGDVWQVMPAIVVVAVSLVWGMRKAVHLNALGVGEEAARGVGVDDDAMLRHAVWLSSALAAVAVALAGIIGFVGLLVPHGLRAIVGRDHRALVPGSVLVGGAFLVISDAIARVIVAPAELPVGILTALTGCPLLLGFLRQRHRVRHESNAAAARSEAEGETRVQAHVAEEFASGPQPVLAASGVSVRYPGASSDAIIDCSVNFAAGELVALVGPNGSGKSTLLRALAGGISRHGHVLDDGQPRAADAAPDPRFLAWLPQTLQHVAGMTVDELVLLGRTSYLAQTRAGRLFGHPSAADVAAIEGAIDRVGLQDDRATPLMNLSGGQRQRAFLAMTLAQQARVMLLDEPTTALDLPRAAALLDRLRTWSRDVNGLAVIAIHDLPLALARADRVVVMAEGRIIGVAAPGTDALRKALVTSFGPAVNEFIVAPRDPVLQPVEGSQANAETQAG